jgi:hypothetical protein
LVGLGISSQQQKADNTPIFSQKLHNSALSTSFTNVSSVVRSFSHLFKLKPDTKDEDLPQTRILKKLCFLK